MKHNNRNWFWGIFFLLAGVFVIASQLGSFGKLGVWSILGTILLVSLIVHSLIEQNFIAMFLPVAFLYMIYRQPLDLPNVSPWILVLAALLTGIGCNILFRPFPKRWEHHTHKNGYCGDTNGRCSETAGIDDNNPYIKVSFSEASRYLHADALKSAQFFVSFGSLEVFFDQATLCPEGAEVYLDCSFGAIKLYIPKSWKVIDKTHVSLGGMENDIRMAHPAEDAPCLTLSGRVSLGGVEIQYI